MHSTATSSCHTGRPPATAARLSPSAYGAPAHVGKEPLSSPPFSLPSTPLSSIPVRFPISHVPQKKIYYNMRMKTLRRNASDAAARASLGRAHRLVKPRAAYAVLLRALRDAERELGTVQANPPPTNEVMRTERQNWMMALQVKIATTRDALYEREKELKMVEALFADATDRSQHLVDSYVRRMMIELESGGNIRLEDGKPTDIW